MDLYTKTSYELSRSLTLRYSTSFSRSTKLFSKDIQRHIFAIYGLVRIADETVDTYTGSDKEALLEALRRETYAALKAGYSTNPIVHAFALTAKQFNIDKTLIEPFFESMRMDLAPKTYTKALYETYIYGSAEVIGLMCLKVFLHGDVERYKELETGARALGSAYQKVNFLRDIASDYADRQRLYFPGISYETISEKDKQAIIADIHRDFTTAKPYLGKLPASAQKAVTLSYAYYSILLRKLEQTPIETIKARRIRISNTTKAQLAALQLIPRKASR